MGGSHGKLLPAAAVPVRTPVGAPVGTLVGIYVYCVVRGANEPAVTVADARLPKAQAPRVVPLAYRTWLIVADVPLSIYGAAALERRLKDLEWIGAVGVAHQAMVDACLQHDAVVPMKVLTIFASVERAQEEMTRHAVRLRQAMRQVAGCVEWGVRVTRAPQPARTLHRQETQPWMQQPAAAADAEPAAASAKSSGRASAGSSARASAAAPTARASAAAASSGRAFLESKARQRNAVREEAAAVDRHLRTLADTLHEVTRDVRYRLDQAAGATVPVLLDAAYLVPRRFEKRFRAQVRAKSQPLLARGCRVTVTGPWPAYSFVSPASR